MKNCDKLSHQGLIELDTEPGSDTVTEMKLIFYDEFIRGGGGLVNTGYFIGKVLLNRILADNDDAAGILISFGMNKTKDTGGQLQLIIEPASGIEKDDQPNIINEREKYGTSEIGDPPPDGLIPAIKPTPPPRFP